MEQAFRQSILRKAMLLPLLLFLSSLLDVRAVNPPIDPECTPCHCSAPCPGGTFAFTNVNIWPETPMCMPYIVYAWPDYTSTSNQIVTTYWCENATTNCPPSYSTNIYWPYMTTNWWVVSHPGFSGSGPGLGVAFTPTNCGEGTVTFYARYSNTDPCTGQPCGGEHQISINKNFKIINLEITPSATNALINRCQDTNRSVTFCLTNSCYPGGVTWSISPSLTNGATISGGGGCATVKIGDVATSYTITATSNDNTNCVATAGLTVGRDCACTNHVIAANSITIMGGNGGRCAPTDAWEAAHVTTDCGDTVVLKCEGYVRLLLNGSLVGHCPYDNSSWNDFVWKCQCGAVIMKTQFTVVNTGPTDPGYCNGKDEFWTCPGTLQKDCWTVPAPPTLGGAKTARACDGADSIAPDDPF